MLLYSTEVLCAVCYLNIQQLYFILQCTICSVLSSIYLCMYCTYVCTCVPLYIVLLHCSSVCNSWTSIVHCECVLLYCSKYCTSYPILPGTTAPVVAVATHSLTSDPTTEPAQFDSHHVPTTPTESTGVVDQPLTPHTAHCGPSEHKGRQCVLCVVNVQILIIWCVHSIHMQGLFGGQPGI